MRIRLIGSASDGDRDKQFLTTLLINDTVAVDAGSLGLTTLDRQCGISDVLLTHSHADHVASLPVFVENVYEDGRECVSIHGNAHVLDCLRKDVFNDRVWPDFEELGRRGDSPFMRLEAHDAEAPFDVGGLRVTPVEMTHVVPTFGYVIEEGATSVVIASDTAATERIWEIARSLPGLAGVFLECSFPDELEELASDSCHLTPRTFGGELAKLDRGGVPVIAYHIKVRYRGAVVAQIESLGHPDVEVGVAEREYVF